jgi:hypothetical protein
MNLMGHQYELPSLALMGYKYELTAILARSEIMDNIEFPITGSRIVHLGQNIAMLPLTVALLEAHGEVCRKLPPTTWSESLSQHVMKLSEHGPLSIIQLEIRNGIRREFATVWEKCECISHINRAEDAVSQTLRFFGVDKGDATSEGVAIGLEERSFTEDWLLDEQEWKMRKMELYRTDTRRK